MSRILWLLVILPVVAGCDHGPKAVSVEETKRVVVVRPERRAMAHAVSQPATIHALNKATVYAQVAGYLRAINVDKGDAVKKGCVLAVIDVPEVVAEEKQAVAARKQAEKELDATSTALEQAKSTRDAAAAEEKRADANLELQQALYERAKDLRKDGVVSAQDLEIALGHHKAAEAEKTLAAAKVKEADAGVSEAASRIEVASARLDTAAAAVERATARLGYATIRSPLDGIVVERFVDPGAMIQQASASSTQTSPIVTVSEIDRVRIDFLVPEANVAAVATGQRVTVTVDAHRGRAFEAEVTRFYGALDPTTRTMLVEAEYKNVGLPLRPGMFGEATLELERHERALTVPAEAIREHEGARCVFVVEGGVAHRKLVQTGIDTGSVVEILGGIKESDAVVLGSRLTDGTLVVAVERETKR